jgi:ABC-2 type transport system ATP-binding protein
MADPIVCEDLMKVFPPNTHAVDGVSFHVRDGEVFGFLGPNGAGKTTTVQMLTTMLVPTSGRAEVAGIDVRLHPDQVRRKVGIVFQESTSDDELTGRENLELTGALYGVPTAESRTRAKRLLERMQLADWGDRRVKTYSGGMRRRLELAAGLIHSPHLLFLDEPTLGLDPQGRAGLWQYVRELRKESGITVFMTTHYLDEADGMCDRVAIIDHGKIVATGTPSELKDRVGGDLVTLTTAGTEPDISVTLSSLPDVISVTRLDSGYRLKCRQGEAVVPLAVALCARSGVTIVSVSVKKPTLDEAFLQFTGREFREDGGGPSDIDRTMRVNQWRGRQR